MSRFRILYVKDQFNPNEELEGVGVDTDVGVVVGESGIAMVEAGVAEDGEDEIDERSEVFVARAVVVDVAAESVRVSYDGAIWSSSSTAFSGVPLASSRLLLCAFQSRYLS